MRFNLLVSILLFIFIYSIDSQSITVVTENYPPYNYYNEDNVFTGVSTEIVKAVIAESGIDAKIEVYPWARAYKMAREMENVLIFSIYRSTEREELFKWVGSVADQRTYLYSLKSRSDIDISELNEGKIFSIGVARNDNTAQYLESRGFTNLEIVTSKEQSLAMLYRGRVDLADFIDLQLFYYSNHLGFDPNIFERKYFLDEIAGSLYMAFSLQTSDEIVRKFIDALNKIKADGTYEKIYNNFISSK